MKKIVNEAGRVLELARAGDMPAAIDAGEAALFGGLRDPGLAMFVGMLCCRAGELDRGIAHMRHAVMLAPGDPAARIELARALIGIGAFDEIEALVASRASVKTPAGREMLRIQAHVFQNTKRPSDARDAYQLLSAADAADFESWHGLGVALLALADANAAIAPLSKATQLRPTIARHWLALARAYAALSEWAPAGEAAREAVARAPADVPARIELARALAGLNQPEAALVSLIETTMSVDVPGHVLSELGDLEVQLKAVERAEASYRAALDRDPDFAPAWIGLGRLLERTNQNEALAAHLRDAEIRGVATGELGLVRARALRKEGRLADALAVAQQASPEFEPAGRAQLIGQIADRIGDTETAFAAFSEAATLMATEATPESLDNAREYIRSLEALRALTTPDWFARWGPSPPASDRAPPLFIFGFPRSGTTLIDTMLVGHPGAVVMEEEPVISRMGEMLGPMERVADLDAAEIVGLRARYFEQVDRIVPDAAGKLIVDKDPLGLAAAPLLFRLFPDARFVFAERHPCDVVLSCFITSFRLNANVANFYELKGIATLYDRVLAYWERCRAVLPLRTHNVRYEHLVADPEAVLRPLAAFAGLSWTPQLLANEANAASRSYIGSPSYAQVTEPIYARAAGRWLKYREQMEPVLPILMPWIEKMGYAID